VNAGAQSHKKKGRRGRVETLFTLELWMS